MGLQHDHVHHEDHFHTHHHEDHMTEGHEKGEGVGTLPLWSVKLLAALLLVAVSVGGSMIPVWIAREASKQAKKGVENPKYLLFKSILSIINCFAAGAFLGLAFVHLLPEAVEQLSQKDFLLNLPAGGERGPDHAHPYNLAYLLAALGFSAMLALELLLTGGHTHCHEVSVPLSLARGCSSGFVGLSEGGVAGSPCPPSPRSLPHASHHHHAQHHLLCTGASYCPDCDDCVEATTTANGVSGGEKEICPPLASRSLPSEKDFPGVGSFPLVHARGGGAGEGGVCDGDKAVRKGHSNEASPSTDPNESTDGSRGLCYISMQRRIEKEETRIELPIVMSDCMQHTSGAHTPRALDELASPYQESPSSPVTPSRPKLSSLFSFPSKRKLSASCHCNSPASANVAASPVSVVSPSPHPGHVSEEKRGAFLGGDAALPTTPCCGGLSIRKRQVDDAANENHEHTGNQKEQGRKGGDTGGHCASSSTPCCRGRGGRGAGGERGSSCHTCTDHSHSPDAVSRVHAGSTGANVQGGDDLLDRQKTTSDPAAPLPLLEERLWSPAYCGHAGDEDVEEDCHGFGDGCPLSSRSPGQDKKGASRHIYTKITSSLHPHSCPHPPHHKPLRAPESPSPPVSPSSFVSGTAVLRSHGAQESSRQGPPPSHTRTGATSSSFSDVLDAPGAGLEGGCQRAFCVSKHGTAGDEGFMGTAPELVKGGGGSADLKGPVGIAKRGSEDNKRQSQPFPRSFVEGISHCDGTKKGSLIVALAVHAIFEGIVLGTTRQTADVWIATLAILGHKGAEAVAVASTLLQLSMKRAYYVMMLSVFVLASPVGIFIGSFAAASKNTGLAGVFNALAVGAILFAMNEMLSEFTGRCSRRRRLLKIVAFLVGLTLLFGLDLLHAPFCHQHGGAHDHYHTDGNSAHADHTS